MRHSIMAQRAASNGFNQYHQLLWKARRAMIAIGDNTSKSVAVVRSINFKHQMLQQVPTVLGSIPKKFVGQLRVALYKMVLQDMYLVGIDLQVVFRLR
jgi:hypothetical protein